MMVDEVYIEELVRRVVERLVREGRIRLAKAGCDGDCENCENCPGSSDRAGAGPGDTHRPQVRKLVSEWDVLEAHRSGVGYIVIGKNTIITPMARDRARDLRVELISG